MQLTYTDLEEGFRRIELAGRLDLEGANEIDLRFTALAATQKHLVIVDLSQVDFLASIGLSLLVRAARSARLREGNLVLLSPQPNVERVLITTHLDKLLPICHDLHQAQVLLKAEPL